MANLVVDGSANALREALVAEWSRDAAQFAGFVVNPFVDLLCADSGTDILCHIIQNGDIHFTAFPDALDLLRRLDYIMSRHNMSFQLKAMNLFIEPHVAILVLFTAAAPARVVTFQFLTHFLCFPPVLRLQFWQLFLPDTSTAPFFLRALQKPLPFASTARLNGQSPSPPSEYPRPVDRPNLPDPPSPVQSYHNPSVPDR